jgi:protocatechuate 3,4-dioxygenase beta subunit
MNRAPPPSAFSAATRASCDELPADPQESHRIIRHAYRIPPREKENGMTYRIDRREALATFGAVSLSGLLAACGDDDGGSVTTGEGTTSTVETKASTSSSLARLFDESASCSVTPEETEGPYYFDVDSIRSDIREDREGVLLRLALRVRDAKSCEPIENAVVDIWHCDALGIYSGFESASTGGGGPGGGSGPTDDETYLRGAQATNADGIVEFRTVYPGWYAGRTVHIHAKVHLDKQTVLTSQLFFSEAVNEDVYKREPYSRRTGRDVFNDNDNIFDDALLVSARKRGDGYLGLMTFDVQTA